MDVTTYEHERDFDTVHRMWQEVGWVDDNKDHKKAMKAFLPAGHGSVALIDGDAEALGHWSPGTMRYADVDLPMCAVTAITTSRVARKLGLASTMTARTLSEGKEAGCAVAALGIFDQGFYDRFGFGTGSYEHRWAFDPASLLVDSDYRTPVRISKKDWKEIHRVLTGRYRVHGSITLDPPEIVKAELLWIEKMFGLGYRDDDGHLTHFILGTAKGEQGPYHINWLGYETPEQIRDLLRLIKELSDQVASVSLMEPPEIQMQDFLARPFRQRARTIKSDHETSHRAMAFWQARILDLEACIAARTWIGPEIRFHLDLTDPLENFDADAAIGGDYLVTIAAESSVELGTGSDLPTLTASVNAFTRMWLGVRSASSLSISDELSGPKDLLEALDEAFCLPAPRQGWFF